MKLLAKNCNFGPLEDSLIRDKIVSGIRDLSLQSRLLRIPNLTAAETESQCRIMEDSKFQVKGIRKTSVDEMRHKRASSSKFKNSPTPETVSRNSYDCFKCGTRHKQRKCPAFGEICHKCNKPNHFSVGCRFNFDKDRKKFNKNLGNQRYVNELAESKGNDSSDSDIFIHSLVLDNINCNNIKLDIWTTNVKINNKDIVFKLDSGANYNCLPVKFYKKLKLNVPVEDCTGSLITYGNNKLNVLGYVTLKCEINTESCNIRFVLVDVDSMPILGLKTCSRINLLCKVDTVTTQD